MHQIEIAANRTYNESHLRALAARWSTSSADALRSLHEMLDIQAAIHKIEGCTLSGGIPKAALEDHITKIESVHLYKVIEDILASQLDIEAPSQTSDADFVRRAMAAWFRSKNQGQPNEASSVYETKGRRYVELVNATGTLAVYRIENAGRLKRLKRWPKRPQPPLHVVSGRASELPIRETLEAFGLESAN